MTGREEMLHRVRTALQDRPTPSQVVRSYRTAGSEPASLALFAERVEEYKAQVHRCTVEEVPALLGRLAPGSLVVPAGFPQQWLAGLADVVGDDPPLSVRELEGINTVVTLSAVAVAETGTVVLDAGPGQGRRALSLVPDHHVVIVRFHDVVAGVPDALARLDPRRPQTWISGPSATSDIELERVEGVHGPRRLDVVVVT